jgi:hypothetical protein
MLRKRMFGLVLAAVAVAAPVTLATVASAHGDEHSHQH